MHICDRILFALDIPLDHEKYLVDFDRYFRFQKLFIYQDATLNEYLEFLEKVNYFFNQRLLI